MTILTPAEFREKWARRLKGAGEDIKRGVLATRTAPSEKAIAKKDKMRANILAAIDDGSWEAGLAKYSLEDWKRDMVDKGVARIAGGVDAASGKVEDFAKVLLPHIESGQSTIERMPDLTIEDSKSRAVAWIDHMHTLKYKKR